MGRLYDLHQDRDQKWRWFGVKPGSDILIVSRRSWETRPGAEVALSRYLQLCNRVSGG
jgi:hypothetical protein